MYIDNTLDTRETKKTIPVKEVMIKNYYTIYLKDKKRFRT